MPYPTLVYYHLNFGYTGNKVIRNSTMFNVLAEESLTLLSNGQKHQYRYERSRNELVLARYDKKFLKKNNFDEEKDDFKVMADVCNGQYGVSCARRDFET